MKYLIAMDSYKGNLTAEEVCETARDGIVAADPDAETIILPLADGGEGTAAAIARAMGGTVVAQSVIGPFGDVCDGYYGDVRGEIAIVDTAAASGIVLAAAHGLDPLRASTFGTGRQIAELVKGGYRKIIVGLGGSGTNDGGIGAAHALGVRFYDFENNEIDARRGGAALADIKRVDVSGLMPELREVDLRLMYDVAIPLTGDSGATVLFSRQKGATDETLPLLERGMKNYSEAVKASLGIDPETLLGAGAAGGLGTGLAICGGKLTEGAPYMLETVGFSALAAASDIVITGEGKTDCQSEHGKLPVAVASAAKKFGLPVVCVCGSYEPSPGLYELGIDAVFSTMNAPMPLQTAIKQGKAQLRQTCYDIAGLARALRK